MKTVAPQASNNSSAKNKNVIKVNVYRGTQNGNIFPVTTFCEIKLDFSCEDNSQYIPVI
jgi:hypothetical protein